MIEDGPDGLEAALRAGMRCIITYTESTRDQASVRLRGEGRQGGRMRGLCSSSARPPPAISPHLLAL